MQLLYILQVIFGIGILIFVHELGHFLFAKKCGVRVDTFAIGFGYRLFGWRRNKEGKMIFSLGPVGPREPGTEGHTDYRVSLVPLGGYVSMSGEEPTEHLTGADWEFPSKTVGERAQIIVAGVVFNTIFAFLAFIAAFQLGVMFTYNELGVVSRGGAAWVAGLDEGDKIINIDGDKISDFDDLATTIAFSDPEKGCLIKFIRGGKTYERRIYPKYNPRFGFQTIGIGVKTGLTIYQLSSVAPDVFPARDAGIQPLDKVVGVGSYPIQSERHLHRLLGSDPSHLFHFKNKKTDKDVHLNLAMIQQGKMGDNKPSDLQFQGRKFTEWRQFQRFIAGHPDTRLPIQVVRDGKELELPITPAAVPTWYLGIQHGVAPKVEVVRQHTLAAKYFQDGDKIEKVGDKVIKTRSEFVEAVSTSRDDLIITVTRNKESLPLSLSHQEIQTSWFTNGLQFDEKDLTISHVRQDTPVANLFQDGDKIVAFGKTAVSDWNSLARALEKAKDKVSFTVLRDDKKIPTMAVPLAALRAEWTQDLMFSQAPVVGKLTPGFPAAKHGMKAGDEIAKINDTEIDTWQEMYLKIQSLRGESMALEVKRGEKTLTYRFQAQQNGVKISKVGKDSPLAVLKPADQVLMIGNTPVYSTATFRDALLAPGDGAKKAVVIRDGKRTEVEIKEKITEKDWGQVSTIQLASGVSGKIGVRPKAGRYLKQENGLVASIVLGCHKSWVMIKRIFMTLKSILTAQVSAKNLGGPVLIAQASYSVAQQGFGTLLYFLGLLSLNLAVINILPIPILDGGHLVFLAIEKIKGSAVTEQTMIIANYIGLVLLLMLMLFVTYNDIMRIFR